ncbi:MAG: electron transport complex subunit E [Oscillospiraceae bacterium]|nr:electron transport complex subunit E [Oscillospiraceae bacterium]
MKKFLAQLKNGIITENPSLVLLLGMCATMAVSTSLQNGVGMGLATTAVLICSNTVVSLLRKVIPSKIRIASYVVIIAGFVTIVEMLLDAYIPSLAKALGVFLPLIVVNCIILARAEAYASKNPPLSSAVDGLSMGLGFTFSLCAMSIIRELVGNGTLWGLQIIPKVYEPAMMAVMPVGGFLTLGFLIALIQHIRSKQSDKKEDEE